MRYSLWSCFLGTAALAGVSTSQLGSEQPEPTYSERFAMERVAARGPSMGAGRRVKMGTCHQSCPSCSVPMTWETTGPAGRGFGFDYEAQPCDSDDCSGFACNAPENVPVMTDEQFAGVLADIASNDLGRIKSAITKHQDLIVLNIERRAIQVLGCGGSINGHVKLSLEFATELENFVLAMRYGGDANMRRSGARS